MQRDFFCFLSSNNLILFLETENENQLFFKVFFSSLIDPDKENC